MSTTDPFRYDDAAYVLGALAPDERAAFEAHLRDLRRVRRAGARDRRRARPARRHRRGRPACDEPMPDTLLPSLLRGGDAGTAAAAAARSARWPRSRPPASPRWSSRCGRHRRRHARPRAQFVAGRRRARCSATATLTAKAWGTAIDVQCHYLDRASSAPGATTWSPTTARASRTSSATGNCRRTRTSTTRPARR